jgi:hypothetical protein
MSDHLSEIAALLRQTRARELAEGAK